MRRERFILSIWLNLAKRDNRSVNRGMRLLNGRQQMLIQDEIVGATAALQWRMQYVFFYSVIALLIVSSAPTQPSPTQTTTRQLRSS